MDGTWDEYALLDEIAKTVSEARRRKEVEFLRRCPQSIVSRCWAALDCEDWDDCAANILLDRGRALWEAGEIGGALDLKRLFEMAFRTRLEIAQTAMSELTDRPRNLFMKKAREKGLTQNAIHANVVGAVADSCFHETADAESHFTGACVLLFYRVMLLDAEPTGFAAAGCAIAEAFGFYRAGQINAARDTLLFALPIMELIEPRTDWQRAAIAATYVFRTGLAAKTAEDLEMVEKLMQLAARLFEPKGNDYARCLYYLSEAAGKSGRLGEQLRLLKRILEVPNIRDDELLQIARTGVSVCRAELEGRPELFDLGDNDARGIPKDLALLSKEFAVKAMSGINTTSEEERRYAQALIDWSKYCETQGNRAGTFWAAVTLLRVALSHGSANFPMSYRNILSLADRYESHGDAADRMQYESLKAVAEEAIQAECAALSSHESFTIGGLTQSLRDIRSRK